MAGTVVAQHLEGIAAINKVSASPDLKDKLARYEQILAFVLLALCAFSFKRISPCSLRSMRSVQLLLSQ